MHPSFQAARHAFRLSTLRIGRADIRTFCLQRRATPSDCERGYESAVKSLTHALGSNHDVGLGLAYSASAQDWFSSQFSRRAPAAGVPPQPTPGGAGVPPQPTPGGFQPSFADEQKSEEGGRQLGEGRFLTPSTPPLTPIEHRILRTEGADFVAINAPALVSLPSSHPQVVASLSVLPLTTFPREPGTLG